MRTPPGHPTSVDELLRPAAEAAVALAVQMEGRDPPASVPRGLRPFLRFTRLPDRALAATRRVLEEDVDFRGLVRDATSEARLGRPSWIFLDRPPGWEEELAKRSDAASEAAAAAREERERSEDRRRIQGLEAGLRRGEVEAERLRSLLAEAKEHLGGERRLRSRAESEAGRLRRRLAEVEAEAEQERARTEELALALDRSLTRPSDVADVEVERAPTLDIDVDALAEAVSAGADAATALATVLADIGRRLEPLMAPPAPPPPPSPHSSDGGAHVTRPVELPPAILDDSVEAAEFLVRVPGVLVLVDGYNVTKLARPDLALPEQRRWLADAGVELAARSGARLELVFDGAGDREAAPAEQGRRSGVQVRFTPAGLEADDLLLQMVEGLRGVPAVVASDDRAVRAGAHQLGANVISSPQLLGILRRPRSA